MKNLQENLATLNIWSRNVTTSTREPTTRAWISADIWRQDGAICSKNRKIVPYHGSARIPRLAVSVPDYGSWKNIKRKRSHSKTLSRVERSEDDAFWKRCLVWTEKTMLSENGDVIKIHTTGRQTTRPWVSKMADKGYSTFRANVAGWHYLVYLSMRTEGMKAFSNGCVVVWTGENDTKTCGRKSFCKGSKNFRLKTD